MLRTEPALKMVCFLVIAVEPVVGTHPNVAAAVFVNIGHYIIAQTMRLFLLVPVMDHTTGLCLVTVKPAIVEADPKHPAGILKHRIYLALTQAAGIIGIVPPIGKLIIGLLHFIDPAAVCADPQNSRLVIVQGIYNILAYTRSIVGMGDMLTAFFVFNLKFYQPTTPGSCKDYTLFLGTERIGPVIRQTVVATAPRLYVKLA